ncbi:hypothetical protein Bca4012_097274 [Brassica carinata]|uniref:NAC domain-containing protein n=1 Tax=Brassica carinata TaxID=52824 RepID=A0A8X7U240_BRACI|nr:hypothetical protein Bca52824_079640 [Brassica carinata]
MTQAPSSSHNHGVVILPKCVGFFPDDQEIIQLFLTARIQQKDIEERDTVQRGLDFVAQRKVQGPEGNPWGIWVPSSGKSEIKIGNQILGYKQKFEFFIKHKLNSGWYQIEYTRCANAFETTAVSHLVYDQQNEYVPYMNFHVYQVNGKEGSSTYLMLLRLKKKEARFRKKPNGKKSLEN